MHTRSTVIQRLLDVLSLSLSVLIRALILSENAFERIESRPEIVYEVTPPLQRNLDNSAIRDNFHYQSSNAIDGNARKLSSPRYSG